MRDQVSGELVEGCEGWQPLEVKISNGKPVVVVSIMCYVSPPTWVTKQNTGCFKDIQQSGSKSGKLDFSNGWLWPPTGCLFCYPSGNIHDPLASSGTFESMTSDFPFRWDMWLFPGRVIVLWWMRRNSLENIGLIYEIHNFCRQKEQQRIEIPRNHPFLSKFHRSCCSSSCKNWPFPFKTHLWCVSRWWRKHRKISSWWRWKCRASDRMLSGCFIMGPMIWGVIKWDPFWGNQSWYKCMVNLRGFSI